MQPTWAPRQQHEILAALEGEGLALEGDETMPHRIFRVPCIHEYAPMYHNIHQKYTIKTYIYIYKGLALRQVCSVSPLLDLLLCLLAKSITLHYIALHCTTLHCIAWHCIAYNTIRHHTIPYHTIPYHTIPCIHIFEHLLLYRSARCHVFHFPSCDPAAGCEMSMMQFQSMEKRMRSSDDAGRLAQHL